MKKRAQSAQVPPIGGKRQAKQRFGPLLHKTAREVNNPCVEYALAGGIAVLFVVLYLLVKPVGREEFCEPLNEESFAEESRRFAALMPLPERGGKDLNAAKFARKVKKAAHKTLKEEDKEFFSRLYAPFCEKKEEIDYLLGLDYSALGNLPFVGTEPRTVKIAQFVLSHSKFLLAEDRIDTAMKAVTDKVTPTFEEILNFPIAVCFCLLRKLAAVADNLEKMIDIAARARRIAAHPARAEQSPDFHRLKNNVVFNRICAAELGYEGAKFDKSFGDLADEAVFYTDNVFVSLRVLQYLDFCQYYKPLNILAKYDVLKNSKEKIVTNYFNALSRQSERENLDETAYALRLENYISKGIIPPLEVRARNVGKKRIAVCSEEDNIVSLARALTSDAAMQLSFGGGDGKSNKASKIRIKSEKPPKTETYTIKLGISERDRNLVLSPALPSCVEDVVVEFEYDGVRHRITFVKSVSKSLTVNGTAMFGVPSVRLGTIPLDIKVGFVPADSDK